MGKKNQSKRVRNRSSNSSISDLDTSLNTKKQKTNTFEESIDETIEKMAESKQGDIAVQLKHINQKLENVITKDDNFLKNMIKDVILQMRSEICSSIEKKLEVMESQMFDYLKENAYLKSQIAELEKKIEAKGSVQTDKINMIERVARSHAEQQNEHAQYSRINNVRINGIPETNGETAEQTAQKVVEKLNGKIPGLNLMVSDIDIAHRIGKPTNQNRHRIISVDDESESINYAGKSIERTVHENHTRINEGIGSKMNDMKKDEKKKESSETMAEKLKKTENEEVISHRQIIVRFVSRMKRDKLLRNRKYLKGSNIFVSEDLTRVNMHVLMVIKKSDPTKVINAWSKNGKIFYKSSSGNVIFVPYQEYHKWLNISWNNV